MLTGKVDTSLKDGIGEITFSSEKANALDANLLKQLIDQINQLSKRTECKILYLKSLGKSFCAGAFFEELKALKTQSEAESFFSLFGQVTVSLREAPQPVIIRMQGPAVGGGVGVLASADLAFGVKESSVRLSEFEIGLGPFVISPVIEAKIGGSRLMELALSGKSMDHNWCIATGLLSKIADDSNQLEIDLQECLEKIKGYPAASVSNLKKIITPKNLRALVEERAKFAAQALIKS